MARAAGSQTAIGKELDLCIGTARGKFIKSFVTNPTVLALAKKYWPLGVAIAALLRYGLSKWLKRQERLAWEKFLVSQGGNPFGAQTGKSEGVPATSRPSVLSLFKPEDGSYIVAKELVLSSLFTVASSVLMIRKAFLLGTLIDLANSSTNRRLWLYYAVSFPLNSVMVTVLGEAANYLKALTVLKWRRTVTHKIHDMYFSYMGYYCLHNRSKEMAVADPDVRICKDVTEMCASNASVVFSLTNACVLTMMFGSAVVRDRDWKWSLLTPSFFLAAVSTIMTFEPQVERFALQMQQSFKESKFTQLLTRMQLHAERICMLQGERCESKLLSGLVGEIYESSKKLRYCVFNRDTIEKCFFHDSGPPSFIAMMAWMMGASIAANDQIAMAGSRGLPEVPLDPNVPSKYTSAALGTCIKFHWSFWNTCSSWGTFTTTFFTLKYMEAGNVRVQELVGALMMIKDQAKEENAKVFLDEGLVIQFDHVSVLTPSGAKLLQDLTFRVDEGKTLLICGHNGAGKSSIIRCLCGLWPVPTGRIVRPGGAASVGDTTHMHNEMYYLPQKPCNVLGSLSDQLTYPEKDDLSEEELRRWLRYVDLEYLANRKIGSDTASRVKSSVIHSAQDAAGNDIDWEVLLSLGEQQALSIARMLYHRPRFAILDECTSAVGKVLERRLFEISREIGISCISITHRPALKEHHEKMLMLTGKLAQDGKGWDLTDLPVELSPVKPRPDTMEEVHRRIGTYMAAQRNSDQPESLVTDHELLEQRSAEYQGGAAREDSSAQSFVLRRWPSSLGRFLAVTSFGFQSREDRVAVAKKACLLAFLLYVRASLMWTLVAGQMSVGVAGILGDKPLLFSEVLGNLVGITLSGCLESWYILEVKNLFQDCWRSVCVKLQDQMMQHATFMKVMNPPGPEIPLVENPMQRLAEMQAPFDMAGQQLISVSIAMSQALYTLRVSWRGVGWLTPLLMVMNYVSFRGAQLVAPDFAKVRAVQSTLESRYQVLHTRLKAIAEPVAFSAAGAAERRIIEPRFEALVQYERRALVQQSVYNSVVTFFTDYGNLPIWLHRLTSMRYVTANNPDSPDGLTPTNVMSNVLFDQTTRMQQLWIQKCVLFVPEWLRIDAYFTRILEMVVAFEAAGKWSQEAAAGAGAAADPDSRRITVSGVDLVTKRGSCLAKSVSFELQEGVPTLVTGPNASGKSLLGSVLLGLWAPAGKDPRVSIPGATGPRPPLRTIMPAPQRIYLAAANLFKQLCYPHLFPDEEFEGILPQQLVFSGLPEGTTPEMLQEHLAWAPLTAVEFPVDAETGKPKDYALGTFPSSEVMAKVLSRPQDREVNGGPFDADFLWTRDEGKRLLVEAMGDSYDPALFPSHARGRRCLVATGIEHVLVREAMGWLTDHAWEDVLSGGEQQRLCFARVLFHAPKFALLDECTSMVAADAEADLYRTLIEWGITPLTLTQRTFMQDLYKQEVRLGVSSADGWACIASGADGWACATPAPPTSA